MMVENKPPYVRVCGIGIDIALSIESESDIEIIIEAVNLLFKRYKEDQDVKQT